MSGPRRRATAASGVARLWASLAGAVAAPRDPPPPAARGDGEHGGASVEFVILLPLFLMVFISSFEASVYLVRQVLMERALDIAVREVRLDTGETVSQGEVRFTVCERARILPNCMDNMTIEMTVVSTDTYELPADDAPCTDEIDTVAPPADFAAERVGRLVLIRACYAVRPILSNSSFAMTRTLASTLVSDHDGAIRMTTATAFVVE